MLFRQSSVIFLCNAAFLSLIYHVVTGHTGSMITLHGDVLASDKLDNVCMHVHSGLGAS